MFALTVDQVDSRGRGDRVGPLLPELARRWRERLLLGPDRTAGDEFQLLTADAATAFALVLELTRGGDWSVGLGIGPLDSPLPATTREASGDALVAARTGVERAKRASHRFALAAGPSDAPLDAAQVEALIDLLLAIRARRTPEGWAVADRLQPGTTQTAVARELGITPQAVSLRARSAGLHLEARAMPALIRALALLDVQASS